MIACKEYKTSKHKFLIIGATFFSNLCSFHRHSRKKASFFSPIRFLNIGLMYIDSDRFIDDCGNSWDLIIHVFHSLIDSISGKRVSSNEEMHASLDKITGVSQHNGSTIKDPP